MNKTLTKAEEEIMHYIWEYQPCSVKDIMAKMSEPKPAYNTVSTIVRILERKEFVYHQAKGRGYVYLSKVDKASYSKTSLDKLLGGYFQGSMKSMLSFFVKSNDISVKELDEIMDLIEKSKNRKS